MKKNGNIKTSDHIVEEIDIKDYLRVIIRHMWVIMAFLITSVTIGAIYTFQTIPVYKVSTQVLIGRENPNVVSIEEVVKPERGPLQWNQTQIKILSSRSLALRVIKALNLKDSREFKPEEKRRSFNVRLVDLLARKAIKALTGEAYTSEGIEKGGIKRNDSPGFKSYEERKDFSSSLREKLASRLGLLVRKLRSKKDLRKPDKIPDKSEEDSRLIGSYLSRLKVEAIKYSRLVNINFEGHHPDVITAMANRHAHEYIEQNREMRFAATQDAIGWLQERLGEKETRVEKAENQLQIYKENEQIVSLEDRQNIIVQKLEDLNTALTNARTERIGLETLYNRTKILSDNPDMMEAIPYVMENSLIQDLKKDYIKTKAEIVKLRGKYGEKFPTMVKLVSQAKEQENRINSEVNKLIKSLETKYKVAWSKEESLSKALEEQKKTALDLNRKAIAYGTLKRESESEKAMYDVLLNRMKETDIAGELKTSNVRIIDAAVIPKSPIKPRRKLNILVSAVIGLILGVGIAVLFENLDATMKRPEDVERYLGLSLLSAFEKVKDENGKPMPSFDMIAHKKPRSNIAEAFRNMRTNLTFAAVKDSRKLRKLVLITSVAAAEGKTFVASNLAVSLAQTGKKVLLVDTDFHNPRLNKVFNMSRKPGLSNHLVGENTLSSIIKPTKIPNLRIITCGRITHNPSELLGSDSMEKFCKAVRRKFDMVVFDTPPSMAVTDAVVLSNILDGVIFVVKYGVHDRKIVERAISQMTDKDHEILGVVMNHIDVSRGSYYYPYYASYYRYGYNGKDNGKSKTDAMTDAMTDAKTFAKTFARTFAKTFAMTEAKTDVKTDAKTFARTDANRFARTDANKDAKTDTNRFARKDARTDARTDAKTDAKTDVKTDAKTFASTDAKTFASTDANKDARTDANKDARTFANTFAKTDANRFARTDAKTDARTDARTDTKKFAKTDAKKNARTDAKKFAKKNAKKNANKFAKKLAKKNSKTI